ncbi:MAG TPA: PTS fructose transporter subunit IIB [Anaerolineae bacterium]|nr:PTS fructose transporter subunit IIB [Anaerolineae bacterium]
MKIVAITACGAGIAHTYMAAEGLKKAAKATGDEIRVEIQGAMGIEYPLTKKEIDEAALIIFATNIGIRDRDRFSKNNIIELDPGEFIANPIKAFQKAKKMAGFE